MLFELKPKCWAKGTHAKGWEKSIWGRRCSQWKSGQDMEANVAKRKSKESSGRWNRGLQSCLAPVCEGGALQMILFMWRVISTSTALFSQDFLPLPHLYLLWEGEGHLNHGSGRRKWTYVALPSLSFLFFGMYLFVEVTYSDLFWATVIKFLTVQHGLWPGG